MAKAEPWQTAEIPGPTKALVVTKPEVVVAMVKRAKRPVLVVGHEAAETDLGEGKPIDLFIRIAQAGEIPVVATAHIVGEFIRRGFKPAAWMPAMDIANRLLDPAWEGLDGKGRYDLALFTGIPYYMEWVILSGLKHFILSDHKPDLKTINLNPFYQPHASWSFPNLSLEEWVENLKVIIEKLGGK